MTENLKPTTYNKTIVFYSPLEGEDVLVRTGTIDNNSFYHSILHATSKEYANMNTEKDRNDFMKRLKKSIFSSQDIYSWRVREESRKEFSENLERVFKDFYDFLESNRDISFNKIAKKLLKSEELLQYHRLISQLISIASLQELITDTFVKTENLEDFKSKFLKKLVKYYVNIDEIKELDTDKKDEIQLLIETMVSKIYKESEKLSYELYQENLLKNEIVNNSILNKVSSHLDRDIYLLNGENRLPFEIHIDEDKQKKKSIILIKIIDKYEVVGRLLPGNKIQREFISTNDELIERVRKYTFNPDVEKKKYHGRLLSSSRSPSRSPSRSRSQSPSRSRSQSP
jgi:hypothetical protein